MKSKTKIIHQPNKAIKELNRIAKSMSGPDTVKVGFPKGSNDYPDGTSVIMVGAVNEFGSPSRNVPERSFLRSTMKSKRRAYKSLFKKLAQAIVNGKLTTKQAIGKLGLQVQADVVAKITDINTPTLKHREGNPLVDTGHLRQSITFEVGE